MTKLSFGVHAIFISKLFDDGMKLRNIISSLVALGLLAGCATEKEEQNEQAKLQAEAKVSKAEAQKIALAQAPNGIIKEGELEKEKGQLIWSFDIATPDSKDITEVNVDANNGKVVSVQKETPEDQAKEKAEDAKKEGKEKD
jgi:major membrane immunogen (membrane-anchored lipoprotein)